MNYVNLTPHDVHLYVDHRVVRTIPPSGKIARVVDPNERVDLCELDGVRVGCPSPLDGRRLVGLPDYQPGTVCLVSVLCLDACRALGRHDCLAPDTASGAVRDERGRILGTRRLLVTTDQPPEIVVLFGSATIDPKPRDVDLMVTRLGIPALRRILPENLRDLPLDMFTDTASIKDGAWTIRVPSWGPEDPTGCQILYTSATYRPVRVERVVASTGPARVRRFAATGTWHDGPPVEVELRRTGPLAGYRGSGLVAWSNALAKVTDPAGLPDFIRQLQDDLPELLRWTESAVPDPGPANQAGAGNTPVFLWSETQGGWCQPYGDVSFASMIDAYRFLSGDAPALS